MQQSHIEDKISSLKIEKTNLEMGLFELNKLKRLLFATGPQLEEAILQALRLLSFTAEGYKEGDSEFDAVFISPEGRFLGEAEGKDNKAINIDKLSQLERNLQEDFAREDVTDFAKGVLFGNAFRLVPPGNRADFFTEKCLSGAKRSKVALVRTPDLFVVAKYLQEHNDSFYAELCRKAILQTEGEVVVFPPLPNVK